jgi:uncharacterized RDD family membrane protein YckC
MKDISSNSTRFIAALLDNLIFLFVLLLFIWGVSTSGQISQLLNSLLKVVIFLPITTWIFGLFWVTWFTSEFGGSVGKIVAGLQVVNKDGQKIGFWQSFWRHNLGYAVSGLLFWLGFLWVFKDKQHRAWHDLMNDTYVITSHKNRFMLGLIVVIILFVTDSVILVRAWTNFMLQKPLYHSIIEDLKEAAAKNSPPPRIEENLLNNEYIYQQ